MEMKSSLLESFRLIHCCRLGRLGNSGLKISKIILGAMSYGSPKWEGWVLNEKESLPLLEHAYNSGINTWDTVCSLSSARNFG